MNRSRYKSIDETPKTRDSRFANSYQYRPIQPKDNFRNRRHHRVLMNTTRDPKSVPVQSLPLESNMSDLKLDTSDDRFTTSKNKNPINKRIAKFIKLYIQEHNKLNSKLKQNLKNSKSKNNQQVAAINGKTLKNAVSTKTRSNLRTKRLVTFAAIAGIFLFVGLYTLNAKPDKKLKAIAAGSQNVVKTRIEVPTVLGSSIEALAESPPSLDDSKVYTVAPHLPRRLVIPKLSVISRVLSASTNTLNDIQVPKNIFDVAWYDGSSLPGDKNGAGLIIGHTKGQTRTGVFSGLELLEKGDKFEIEMGDKTKFTYKVVDKKLLDGMHLVLKDYLKSQDPVKTGLNLMSFTSRSFALDLTKDPRIVIFSTLDSIIKN